MDEKIEDIALRDKVGKPQVTEEFVEKWGRAIDWYFTAPVDKNGFVNIEQALKQMLKEAGVSVG